MGSSMSCVPQHNFRYSSKSFIRRNSSRLFRKKNPQEGQEKSNSIINILCTVTPRKDMSPKDLRAIEDVQWEPPFPYDPASGWKKSSINVKNYGRMVHSSRVRFRFLHCQDVHDCYLDLFQTHLHFVSNNTTGLTYQGTLPLKELTICNLQQNFNHSQPQEFAFQINGVSLNPIIVYCANQKEMDLWFGLLKENIEANGGVPIAHENYTRVKRNLQGREELRNSINREPIYEWEGSQRNSLGAISYVTKVRLQHLPCQEQSDRLLVMYPATLIILSEESDGLFYKGKLPLNMITVTTPCQDVKPNTFMIEGKLINPIVVSCLDKTDFCDWIQHFKAADVPVLTPPPPVYDIIYTPTHRETPQFDRWSGHSQGPSESQSGRGSHNLAFPRHEDNPLSPGYTEPLCYTSSRPGSIEATRLGSRTNSSASSHTKPERDLRPLSLRYSSPLQRGSSHPLPLPSEDPAAAALAYRMPYANPQHREKARLVKSNSWGTPHTHMSSCLNDPQRHSDMCGPRQPLSPLYDEPATPDVHAQHNMHGPARPVQSWLQNITNHPHKESPPPCFQLRTPPMGRRCRRSLTMDDPPGPAHHLARGLDEDSLRSQAQRRAEAVSRLKLLPAPTPLPEQRLIPSSCVMSASQMPYAYSPDPHSYLQPTEPDDQEMDYDNIWEYDCNTGMIQPASVISQHRTGLEFVARGPGVMATQQRWS